MTDQINNQFTEELLPQFDNQGSSYELVFTDPSQNIESRFPIEENQEINVGASYENEVLVEDQYMSGKHFLVKRSGDKIQIQDKQSKNGLFIKLEQAPFEIVPGQTILAGKTRFRIEVKQ